MLVGSLARVCYKFSTQKISHFFPLTLFLLLIFTPCISHSNSEDFLTIEEREWLDAHNSEIRLAPCPGWEPMEIIKEDGSYHGMVADYIHILEKLLDIKFKIIQVESWNKVQDMARNRELDIISAAKETPERKSYMDWTEPYFKSVNTIITQKSVTGELNIQRLQNTGMVTGVPEGYYTYDYFKEKYPKLNLVHVKDALDGIKQLAFDGIDAMIMEVPHALYYIEKYNISNLRMAGISDFHSDFSVGTRNDWPILHSIMVKAVAQITQEQRKEINNKWIGLELTPFYKNTTFWYIIIALLAVTGTTTAMTLLWNRSLKVQVSQRTEESKLNEMRLEALLKLNNFDYDSMEKVMEFAFKEAVRLTKSCFGYLAFAGQDGIVYCIDSSQKYSSAKEPEDSFHYSSAGFPIETMGLWGDAINEKKPVIANDYLATNPLQEGIPKQYSDIVRYMNIPVFNNNEIVAVAGVGNKETDYDESDLRQLTLLMEGMWQLIQRRNAETSLRNSEKLFRDLVENSLTGISIIQNGKTIYRNPEHENMVGLISIIESEKAFNIHPEDKEKVTRFFNFLRSGKAEEFELDFRFYPSVESLKRFADMKWVNCRANEIKYQDKKAVLLNIIDTTRAKEFERLLFIQEKMVSLGRVTAGIAHEVRNPLSGINIHMRNLEKLFSNYNNPSEKITKILRLIQSDANRIESIIRRAMDFSKPYNPCFTATDINMPVKKAIQLTATTLRKKGTLIEIQLKTDLPLCYAEPQLIEDVILNLITNASDAMKGMQEKKITIVSFIRKNQIIVTVDDTGPGVESHLFEKIFEPFFTTKDYSTGIGLSICHRILTDHGGTLRVEPNPQSGARFILEIPVWKKNENPKAKEGDGSAIGL